MLGYKRLEVADQHTLPKSLRTHSSNIAMMELIVDPGLLLRVCGT